MVFYDPLGHFMSITKVFSSMRRKTRVLGFGCSEEGVAFRVVASFLHWFGLVDSLHKS
jgi:hypothetical protein